MMPGSNYSFINHANWKTYHHLRDSIVQHIKRTSYQVNFWEKALCLHPNLPSPIDWGWHKDSVGWQPLWTNLPEASESCYELIHCGGKKGCRGKYKCQKASLKCTLVCACSGTC